MAPPPSPPPPTSSSPPPSPSPPPSSRPASLRPSLPSPKTLPALLLALAASPALAADASPPPPALELQAESPSPTANPFDNSLLTAPQPSADLPDGAQWRYSDFVNAVQKGKVERVRFSKDDGLLQTTAIDGMAFTI